MYLLADILYFIAYYVVRYRRKVTRRNLTNSYPHMGDTELVKLERAYYRHMSDLLIEAIVNLYASPKWIMKHYRIVNRELVNSYYNKGQSVVLMSAHYNNWEYMITSLNFQLLHHGVGVGKPLNDKALATYVTRRRSRYGTEIVDQTDVRETMTYYHQHQVPVAYMMLSDQSPSNEHKSYWTTFMNQDRAFCPQIQYARAILRSEESATRILRGDLFQTVRHPERHSSLHGHRTICATSQGHHRLRPALLVVEPQPLETAPPRRYAPAPSTR